MLKIIKALCGLILLGMLVFWLSVQNVEPQTIAPDKEPTIDRLAYWYPMDVVGAVMVYLDTGVKLQYAHPILAARPIPKCDSIVEKSDYFVAVQGPPNKAYEYTIMKEATMRRVGNRDWEGAIEKTFSK